MVINDRSKFGKRLMFIAAIISILCVFFMFGRAVHWNNYAAGSIKNNPTLFELAFGLNDFAGYRRPGFTAIFVIEILAIIMSVISILCYFNVLFSEETTPIFAIISSFFSFLLFILAFCSRKLCGTLTGGLVEADSILGFGSILFAISHIFSLGLNVVGVIFTNK